MGKCFRRIWQNFITGQLADEKKDQDYDPTNIVFDSETKIIFYKFSEIVPVYSKNFNNQTPMDTKVGYMCPYINEKGKYCRFVDGEIIEI